ncbi:MAG: thrombospondin type 3 repeat-containing protein [Myxococcota bacterium]
MQRRSRNPILVVGAPLWVLSFTVPVHDADAQPAYVRSSVGAPWGAIANEAAMDTVFGVGGWDDLQYETLDAQLLFSPAYGFIYLEGGDDNALALEAFLSANQAALEAWVIAGGGLLVTAAPNEGANQDWGFGGVTLSYPDVSQNPVQWGPPAHPAFNGPFLPTAFEFTGDSVAHASVTGPGLTALLVDADMGGPPLAELAGFGLGRVVFGGLTTANFWEPAIEAGNLRRNIIAYLGAHDEDADGVPHAVDNCIAVANPMQDNADGDALGDACDACPNDADDDVDGDSFCGDVDTCPDIPNPGQADGDLDGLGDVCDACPADPANDADADLVCGDVDNCPNTSNAMQADGDGDGVGDACDVCPADAPDDADGDGVCTSADNCPWLANPAQADADDDGVGDACDDSGSSGDGSSGDGSSGDGSSLEGTGDGTGDGSAGGTGDDDTTAGGPMTSPPLDGTGTDASASSGADLGDETADGAGSDAGSTGLGSGATPGEGGGCGCRAPAGRASGWWLWIVALARRRRPR